MTVTFLLPFLIIIKKRGNISCEMWTVISNQGSSLGSCNGSVGNALAAKPGFLSLISRNHMVEGQNQAHKLSTDLRIHAMVHAYTERQTESQRERERDTERERETEIDMERDRQTQRETKRDTEKHTERDRKANRDTQRLKKEGGETRRDMLKVYIPVAINLKT